jgi:hypothetical protein
VLCCPRHTKTKARGRHRRGNDVAWNMWGLIPVRLFIEVSVITCSRSVRRPLRILLTGIKRVSTFDTIEIEQIDRSGRWG